MDEPEDMPEVTAAPWDSELGEEVRAERNSRIAATDWMVLPDSPHQRSLLTRGALWLYREALRNLTKTFASPEDVEWPAEPGV